MPEVSAFCKGNLHVATFKPKKIKVCANLLLRKGKKKCVSRTLQRHGRYIGTIFKFSEEVH